MLELLGLEEYLDKLQVIVSEVDGIMTNGQLFFDELGFTPFKSFYHKDFEAINLLKKCFKVVFVSNDNRINYNLFRNKQLPFYYNQKDKTQALTQIFRKYSVTPDNALYIGSTYSDVGCMQMVPFSVCPEDAVSDVKNIASTVLPIYAGDGVFCEVYDLLKKEMHRRLYS
jgi:YrbI family 3-deoxy-D-manno-octulosonate 8-phosphate phosphatase